MFAYMFVKSTESKFGNIATQSLAWNRLVMSFMNDPTQRVAIQECLSNQGGKIHNMPAVQVLLKEFTALKEKPPARPIPVPSPETTASGIGGDSQEAGETQDPNQGYSVEQQATDLLGQFVDEEQQKVKNAEEEAQARADLEREQVLRNECLLKYDQIQRFTSEKELVDCLSSVTMNKFLILVDAANTSRLVQSNYINLIQRVLPKHACNTRVAILAGPTLSGLSAMQLKMQETLSVKGQILDVKLDATQSRDSAATNSRASDIMCPALHPCKPGNPFCFP